MFIFLAEAPATSCKTVGLRNAVLEANRKPISLRFYFQWRSINPLSCIFILKIETRLLFIFISVSQKLWNINLRNSFRNKLQQLERIELMSHLALSVDLIPSDYDLFWSLTTKRRRKLPWKSSLTWRIRTGFSVQSKSWQKGGFRRCNTMASTLNVWLLLLLKVK